MESVRHPDLAWRVRGCSLRGGGGVGAVVALVSCNPHRRRQRCFSLHLARARVRRRRLAPLARAANWQRSRRKFRTGSRDWEREGDAFMIAAIYARKSNQQDVADELKSITQQVTLARKFAESRGWTVARVFEDDAVRIGPASSRFGKLSRSGPGRLTWSCARTPHGSGVIKRQRSTGKRRSRRRASRSSISRLAASLTFRPPLVRS